MNDLISRNELLKRFCINKDGHRIPERDCDNFEVTVSVKDIKTIIKEQPTAYSVDKVVGELKKHKDTTDLTTVDEEMVVGFTIYQGAFNDAIDKAIEIVKQGGVSDASDDVCEWIKYDYRTICPKNHDVNTPYWRIPDNMDKLKYCPYCGKKIKIVGD